MNYNFTDLMSKKTDDELISILTARRGDYTELALSAAQIEFDKREIPKDKIHKIEKEQTEIKVREDALANEPLEKDIKILAMAFPLIARLIHAENFRKGGYERKLAEMSSAYWTGRLIYIAAFILLIILIKIINHFQ